MPTKPRLPILIAALLVWVVSPLLIAPWVREALPYLYSPTGIFFFIPNSVFFLTILSTLTGFLILNVRAPALFLSGGLALVLPPFAGTLWVSPGFEKDGLSGTLLLLALFLPWCAFFLLFRLRGIYLDPSRRWWKQSRRYFVKSPCNWRLSTEPSQLVRDGVIQDLSMDGLQLTTQDPVSLEIGQEILVGFQCLLLSFALKATVIRKQGPTPENGRIYGARITDTSKALRIQLRKLTKLLRRLGIRSRNS
jgi:hypothetical protein